MDALVTWLQRQAAIDPERVAVRGESECLTAAGLVQRVDALADCLWDDVRVIGLLADNGIDWVVADLAGMMLGATVVPIPLFFTPSQIMHVIDSTGLDTLLVDTTAADRLPPGVGELFRPSGSFGRLRFLQRAPRVPVDSAGLACAKITFTSGSTGQPKGVCLSAACIDAVAGRLCRALGHIDIERHLCVLPLATLLENVAGVYVPLLKQAEVHVLPLAALGLVGSSRMDAGQLKSVIEERRSGSVILQPQMLRELTRAATATPWAHPALEYVAIGGARVAESDLDAARAAGIPAYQGYGLSECGSVVALNTPGDSRAGSVGRPLPGLDVHIADDGEILVRGQRMDGYLGERAGAPLDTSEPVATGDLGYLDDEGYLYVTGRSKDVFITAFGRNVSPEWPESELVHEAEISQACVFGEGRTTGVAVVVPAGSDTGLQEIASAIARANERLPDYACISEFIVSREPFTVVNGQLTMTGKPRRHAIARSHLGRERLPVSADATCLPPHTPSLKEPTHDLF